MNCENRAEKCTKLSLYSNSFKNRILKWFGYTHIGLKLGFGAARKLSNFSGRKCLYVSNNKAFAIVKIRGFGAFQIPSFRPMWVYIFALTLSSHSFAAVRVLTFHYNQPDFVELQHKTLQKFLQDDFELIVFNDAKTTENEKGIEKVCLERGIPCIRFQQEWHLSDPLNIYLQARLQEPSTVGIWGWDAWTSIEEIANNPSVRHSHVIQYALTNYGYDHDDIVVIMDGDNFLIQPFSVRELLDSYDIVGFHQRPDLLGIRRKQAQISVPENTEMLWVVFIAFHPCKLPHPRELQFHVDVINNQLLLPNNTLGDTGSAVYRYLQKYPSLKILAYPWQDSGIFRSYFSYQELKDIGFSDDLIQLIQDISPGNVQFFAFEHFLHFAAVSAEVEYHRQKVDALHKFIKSLL